MRLHRAKQVITSDVDSLRRAKQTLTHEAQVLKRSAEHTLKSTEAALKAIEANIASELTPSYATEEGFVGGDSAVIQSPAGAPPLPDSSAAKAILPVTPAVSPAQSVPETPVATVDPISSPVQAPAARTQIPQQRPAPPASSFSILTPSATPLLPLTDSFSPRPSVQMAMATVSRPIGIKPSNGVAPTINTTPPQKLPASPPSRDSLEYTPSTSGSTGKSPAQPFLAPASFSLSSTLPSAVPKSARSQLSRMAHLGMPRWTGLKLAAASALILSIITVGTYFLGSQTAQQKVANQADTPVSVAGQNTLPSGGNVQSIQLNKDTIIGPTKSLTAFGIARFQSVLNSPTAFEIQSAAGAPLLVADTSNMRLGIGTNPTGTAALQVSGNISASGQLITGNGSSVLSSTELRINNRVVCTAAGCSASGSGGSQASDLTNVALLNGQNTFRPATDTTSAFQIQNFAGTSKLLVADTANSRLAIGQASANYTLDINGDVNITSGNAFRINGASICTTAGCEAASGSNNYIQNTTNLQTANFAIQSANLGSVAALIRGATGQTADLLQIKNSSNISVLTVGATGNTLIQPTTDSINAFQILNANATSHLIGGDTLNARVAIAKPTPPDYTLDVGGDINSTTGLRVGGVLVCASSAGCTAASGSGNYIQNGTALQTANFAIQSTSNASVVALIRGASGQSADLLDLVAGDLGVNVARIGASGDTRFQNSVNSTTAFQIQNAVGTSNLFVADSVNSKIGIGTNAPTATLTIKDNFSNPPSTANLTVSGNEITDATRTTNTQGDGKTPPDSSYGIWEGTTNLVANGGFESNSTGWVQLGTGAFTRDTTFAKFGSSSMKTITAGNGSTQGMQSQTSTTGLSANTTYTFSVWAWTPAGIHFAIEEDFRNAGGGTVNGASAHDQIGTGGWSRFSVTGTSGVGVTQAALYFSTENNAPGAGITFWIDGVQVEQKPTVTPYVETNGGTASRSAARTQASASNLNATQGWVVERVRMGFDSSIVNMNGNQGAILFDWADDVNNKLIIYYGSGGKFNVYRQSGGATTVDSIVQSFSAGTIFTVGFKWTASTVGISVNGGPWQLISSGNIPTLSAAQFDIGSGGTINPNSQMQGDTIWFASGIGTLTDADAATLNTFGNADPTLSSLSSSLSSGNPTMAWAANTASYQVQGGQSNPVALQVQDANGANLLSVNANSSVGSVLAIGTNTTAASGGVTFGTDTNFYRSGNGALAIGGTSGTSMLQAAASVGTDAVGNNLILAGGQGTGAGNGGNINLQVAKAGGANLTQSFITGANNPSGVAVNGTFIYWANNNAGTIGRANLDGTSPNQSFITGANGPYRVVVDSAHIYWTNGGGTTIGRANLDGTGVNQSFITGANSPVGITVNGSNIYWANRGNNTIGRANLDGTSPNQSFITGTSTPYGVTVDSNYIYWANGGNNTIGRANLDGTGVNQSFITGTSGGPYDAAVDGSNIYWSNGPGNTIGRANLDGTSPNQSFITGANVPSGLAIDSAHLYWANGATGANTVGRYSFSGSANTLSTVVAISGVNGAASFQNAADSTAAFQIQNAAGTSNLLVADTLNSRIAIGTASATSTLTVSGSGLIQQSTATNLLTTSGNELTDSTRTTNTQGDGKTPPDSSYGIWEGTTNLVINGGIETVTNGWIQSNGGETLTRVTTDSKFGSASIKVDTGAGIGIATQQANWPTATVGQVYAGSAWVKGVAGRTLQVVLLARDEGNGNAVLANVTSGVVATGAWQRVTSVITTPAAGIGATGIYMSVRDSVVGGSTTFFADGMQLEQKSFATPYVETNGSTAVRNAARIQSPATNISATQSWAAFRVRAGVASSSLTTSNRLLEWDADSNNKIYLGYISGSAVWKTGRVVGGTDVATSTNSTFNAGDIITVIASWTSSQISLSINGGAFVTTANTGIPNLSSASTFDIGSALGSNTTQWNGDILWMAVGTGTLSSSDAANIYNLGNTDPNLASFPVLGAPTMVWQANTANYINSANQGLVFSVQNSAGTGLLNVDANNSKLSANVSALFQNASNSTAAFQVQNASATSILGVDTTNGLVNLGTPGSSGTNGQLTFNSTNASGYGITIATSSALTSSYTIKLPTSAPGLGQCLQTDSGDAAQLKFAACASGVGTGDVNQGGNTYGATMVLGTNDNNALSLRTNSNNVLTLGTNGSALFKNSTDSTAAFQIQNSASTSNLLVANTTDSRVGIGTANSLATLNLVGSNLITQGAATSLTTSGNEITDATRTANIQGDGRAAPDSSEGIWEGTTNLVPLGGAESTVTGYLINNAGTMAVSQDSTNAKFGTKSFKAVAGGSGTQSVEWRNDNTGNVLIPVTAGNTYTFSLWQKSLANYGLTPTLQVVYVDSGNSIVQNTSGGTLSAPTTNWSRGFYTTTAPANAVKARFIWTVTGGAVSDTYYFDGVQIEQKAIVTPYVETNGTTASRSAARVQTPSIVLNTTQGWVAARVRMGWSSSAGGTNFPAIFDWRNDASNRYSIYYDQAAARWNIASLNGGVATNISVVGSFNSGDLITIAGYWTASGLAISINGSNFTTGAGGTRPTITASLADIGSLANSNYLDSDILWTATGTGTLTNTDAANLNGFGNTDPNFVQLPAAGNPTMLWKANTAAYSTSSSADNILTLQNNAGTNLLNVDATNAKLTVNTSGLFQNTTNSSNALTINTASGTQLFNANTTNLQLTANNLQTAGAINLTNSNGTVSLASSLQNSTTTLTTSGNEITDAKRTAALSWGTSQQGGSTDGATLPDSGYGIWEAGTNLFQHGQNDSATNWNAAGGGTSSSRTIDATVPAPFSPQSIRVTTFGDSVAQGVLASSPSGQAAAAGANGVGSVYFKGVAGASYQVSAEWRNTDASVISGTATTFTATGAWQLLSPASVAVAAGKTGDVLELRAVINGTRAESFWVANAMLQTGVNTVSPYIATSSGASATRNAARVQAPATNLNATQGWVAARVRPGWASSGTTPAGGFPGIFQWVDPGGHTNEILVFVAGSGWNIKEIIGGTSYQLTKTQAFNAGDTVTVVAYWTSTGIAISINGSSFTTLAVPSSISASAVLNSLFDIGNGDTGNPFDGDILWIATGTGTLSNSDATTLNNLGNTDPTLAKLYSLNSGAGNPTFVWNGNTSNYQDITSSNGQALIFAANTSASPTGNLIDVQSGAFPSSRFSVDVSGKTLFQNSTDSTTAFQIQNSAGTSNLFVADTANSRIGIGTNAPAATLSVNGSGIVQQSAATNSLTVSTNEITDAERALGSSSSNISGQSYDGRTSDSSYGIWQNTTNMLNNGGLETNATGWLGVNSSTVARTTTTSKFGSAALSVVTPGTVNNEGVLSPFSGSNTAASGQTWTASAWVKAASGSVQLVLSGRDNSGTQEEIFAQSGVSMTGSWQRITVTGTLANSLTKQVSLSVNTGSTTQALTFYLDGAQLEQKPYATPYVETNGATATRNGARVQSPASNLTANQGWVVVRGRYGFPSAQANGQRAFWLGDGTGGSANRIAGTFQPTTIGINENASGGSTESAGITIPAWSTGDTYTAIFAWTATNLYLSYNGGAFTSFARTQIPTGLTTLDIGSVVGSNGWIDGDIFWAAMGTGTLTNIDATNINIFGSADPNLGSFPTPSVPTMVWQANTANYQNSSNQAAVFSVQNSVGTNLLNVDANAGQLSSNASALFKSALNSTAAFQVQNASATSILGVDTTNGLVNLGTPGSSGTNGQLTFNSTSASGYGVTIAATSALTSSYTIKLPTSAPSVSQCLQADSVDSTQLIFGACGTGGGGGGAATLQDAYNSSSSPATITTTSSAKGLIVKAGATFDSTTLLQVQNAAGTDIFNVDSTNGRVGIGLNNPTAALSLASGTTAVAGIAFGTDTNFYRSGAGALKTDGTLTAVGELRANGLRPSTAGNTGLWTSTGNLQLVPSNGTEALTITQPATPSNAINVTRAGGTDFLLDSSGRVGIGTAAPSATLSVNGSGLIQQSSAAGPTLTVSGNEITDATRTTNTQGDGRTAPDSSEGIWEGTTNLVTNGGFETNLNGWTNYHGNASLTTDTSRAKFGTSSMKVIITSGTPSYPVDDTGTFVPFSSTAGATYTLSAFVWIPTGVGVFFADSTSSGSLVIGNNAWQRITYTLTANSTDPNYRFYILQGSGPTGTPFWIDGVQVEQKAFATPYVETNGVTASRSAARIQAPAANLNATQGWVAARLRMGFANSTLPSSNQSATVFQWGSGSNYIQGMYYNTGGANVWQTDRVVNNGAGGEDRVSSAAQSFNAGDTITVVFAWTGSAVSVSVNGGVFTSFSGGHIPTIGNTTFDLGSANGSNLWLDSDLLWTATGTGTLTNTDAASINAFGNTDPSLSSFAGTAGSTMAWQANNSGYLTSASQPIVFQVQNSTGSSLFNIDAGASKITSGTSASFQNAVDSTNAFQIQNAAGTSNLFIANTANTRVGIAKSAPNYTLDVGGDINTSGVFRMNGAQISTASLADGSNIGLINGNNSFSGNNTFRGTVLGWNSSDSTAAFKIQNSSADALLTADTTNMRVYIGNPAGDTVGPLLVLSNKTTAGDPAGTNGAMYYNTSLGKFRCYENGAWKDCVYGAQTAVKSASQAFSGTNYADVNDIGFAVGANKSYLLQCSIMMSVTGNGGNLSMNGPASPATYTATFMKASDQSAGDQFTTSSTYDDPNATTAFTITTTTAGSNRFLLNYTAVLANGANSGTWQLRAKAVSGGTLTLYPVSTCDLRPF